MDLEYVEEEQLPFRKAMGDASFEPAYRVSIRAENTLVHAFGIVHTEPFFDECGDIVASYIEESDALVVEPPTDVEPFHPGSPFRHATDAMKDANGALYVADPTTDGPMRTVDAFSTGLGGAMVIGGLSVPVLKYIGQQLNDDDDEDAEPGGVTRRDVLRSGGVVAGGASLFGGSLFGTRLHVAYDGRDGAVTPDDPSMTYGNDDRGVYGSVDYRNVVSADSLCEILEEGGEDTVSVVYGAAHTKDILGYLEDELLRAAKRELYRPYDLVGDEHIDAYTVNDGSWEEVEPFQ